MSDDRKLDPSAHFKGPEDVVDAKDLARADKIEILTNWANELRQLQVAEEENMKGSAGLGDQLAAVERALLSMGSHDRAHDAKA